MKNGNAGALSDLDRTTDVARGDDVGLQFCKLGDLAIPQASGDVGLMDIVDACATAAQVGFLGGADRETGRGQQPLRLFRDLLAML